jgi:hypothetical protein
MFRTEADFERDCIVNLYIISYIFIIITLIERVLGELIFIYSGMLPPDVSKSSGRSLHFTCNALEQGR